MTPSARREAPCSAGASRATLRTAKRIRTADTSSTSTSLASLPAAEPAIIALTRAAAARRGWTCQILDPEGGLLFRLSNGRRAVTLLGGRSPLNDAVAARLSGDKFYTGLLLDRAGFRVPASARCLRPGYFTSPRYARGAGDGAALAFAQRHGFPLVVKPNRLSHGRDVTYVADAALLRPAIARAWQRDYIALAQSYVAGVDLRLDFLQGRFLVGYLRRPAAVAADEPLLNLARGALAQPITSITSRWVEWGRRVGDVLGLHHFGADIRLPQPDADPDAATVIEVNASPLVVELFRQGHADLAIQCHLDVLDTIMAAR